MKAEELYTQAKKSHDLVREGQDNNMKKSQVEREWLNGIEKF